MHKQPEIVAGKGRSAHLRRFAQFLACCVLVSTPAQVIASQSNRNTGELSVETLPRDMPSFLLVGEAVGDCGAFASEPDRLRGAGPAHDAVSMEDHYFRLEPSGRTRLGLDLAALPATREEYAQIVHARDATMAKEGASYYAVIEAFERLRQDFAYWRVANVALQRWTDASQRAWVARELVRREWLIKRDIGMLAHFTQDASSPLHISVHNEGWQGDPSRNYTTRPFRRYIEGPFIKLFVPREQVKQAMPPLNVCNDPINVCVAEMMRQTLAYVEPSYALATQGGFDLDGPQARAFMAQLGGAAGTAGPLAPPDEEQKRASARGIDFMARQGARNAAFTRDLIVKAWHESLDWTINYPPMVLKVRDVEAGQIPSFAHLHGWD